MISEDDFDCIVVGQGLAGSAMAWWLRWSGARVLVIDREAPATSSRIAAGLITPITGRRLVPSWRFTEFWRTAVDFYRRVEVEVRSNFFRQTEMVRLFADSAERMFYEKRVASHEFDGLVVQSSPRLDPRCFSGGLDGFEFTCGGQLDVRKYLRATRDEFARAGEYLMSEIDPSTDLDLSGPGVRLPRLGVTSRWLVFCQGIDAVNNPWFRAVRFKPAKGEILTVRVEGLSEKRVVHRGVWLASAEADLYRVGATYAWQYLDCLPTIPGRCELEARLREFLALPFEVIGHQAAVRPIHRNQFPVLGRHPRYPQLAYFNGLGSKGTLQAPFLASHLLRVLRDEEAVDREVDLNRKTDLRGCHP